MVEERRTIVEERLLRIRKAHRMELVVERSHLRKAEEERTAAAEEVGVGATEVRRRSRMVVEVEAV